MLSSEAFNILFEDRLIDSNTLHGAIIIIDGKIWRDKHYNRFIFPNKQKASKVFYDCMKWHVRNSAFLHSAANEYRNNPSYRWRYVGENAYLFTPEEVSICRDWRQFKRYLVNNRGFRIVEI